MSENGQIVALLTSIDASMKQLVEAANRRQSERAAGASAPSAAIASDRDLDGQYGNPKVTFEPRDWTGVPCKGKTFSECPPEFLEMLAETLDYFAGKADDEGDKTKAGYKRKDAARARGWAARLRSGKHQPAQATSTGAGSDPEWAGGEW